MHVCSYFKLYPWRLRFRSKCASYLFHGTTTKSRHPEATIGALLQGVSKLPLLLTPLTYIPVGHAAMGQIGRAIDLNLNRHGYNDSDDKNLTSNHLSKYAHH